MNKKPKVFAKVKKVSPRTLYGYTWAEYRAVIGWALLLTIWGWIFIGYSIQRAPKTAPNALPATICPTPCPTPIQNMDVGSNKPKTKKIVVEVEAAEPVDPIKYIRQRGEDLGVPNEDIRTMIRIARCESNYRPRAKNPRSTASGIYQVIAGTWYSYNCTGDKWDAQDNIDCGYTIYQKSGFTPWNASKRCWEESL